MFQQARRAGGLSAAVFGFAILAGCASDPARTRPQADAGTGEMPPDETGGQGLFTRCVDGAPVVFGSSMETGGISPDIPDPVVRSTSPPPALSGGTLLALADGTMVALSDPERDRIYIVDLTAGTVLTVALPPGDEPGRLAEDASSRVHVVLRRGGAVATLDPATGTLTSRRDVCTAPRGIAYQQGTDELHVACAGGELVSLPAGGGAATRTLKLERDLRDVVVRSDGALLVSTFRKAEVLVLGTDGKLSTRLAPGSGRLAAPLRGPLLRTPSVAWRMVPFDSSAGSVLLLHQTGVADVVDLAPGGYAGSRDCGGIVQPGLSILAPGAPTPAVASGLGALSLAIDVALSPDHQKVALAVAGNSARQGPTLIETGLDSALPPVPVACGSPANDLENPPPGQVVAVGYGPTGVLFAQTREPAALWRSDSGATISLATDSRADTGHALFHANASGGVACASCHPEGGEDGRVWSFICSGPRRTQSLRGGIGPTAPFHWDGSEVDFPFLLDDVFSGRMAGPLLTDDQKGALLSWVDAIPAMPATDGLDAGAEARGRALFDDPKIACAGCHSGALFTNNATVDVGTGRPFQVPSLRGVVWRAPYMHDGCAPTLSARFAASCGGGDQHGVTSKLTAAQLADLGAYLQSL